MMTEEDVIDVMKGFNTNDSGLIEKLESLLMYCVGKIEKPSLCASWISTGTHQTNSMVITIREIRKREGVMWMKDK